MRKIMKNTALTVLFLFLITFTALLAYLHFFAAGDNNLSGNWTAELDMTERAAATAFIWLQDMEAVSVSMEDMEAYMEDLDIEVQLDMEQTARGEGNFVCNILPESYDVCRQAAYEAFAAAFRELLAERLRMADYTGDTGKEAVEAFVAETFGMPTVSYLMYCEPDLLPSLEDLQAQYDGSGTYESAKGILTRQFETGQAAAEKTERYIRKGSSLILSEENGSGNPTVIYTLQ